MRSLEGTAVQREGTTPDLIDSKLRSAIENSISSGDLKEIIVSLAKRDYLTPGNKKYYEGLASKRIAKLSGRKTYPIH